MPRPEPQRARRTLTIAQPTGPLTVNVLSDLTDADVRMIAFELREYIKAISRRKHRR